MSTKLNQEGTTQLNAKIEQIEKILKLKSQKKGNEYIAKRTDATPFYVAEVVKRGKDSMVEYWTDRIANELGLPTDDNPEVEPTEEEINEMDEVNPDQPDAAEDNKPTIDIPTPTIILEPTNDPVGDKLVESGVITKEQQIKAQSLPEEKTNSRVKDGKITEIIGKCIDIKYSCNSDIPSKVEVEDADGRREILYIPSALQSWNVFYRLDGKKYLNGMSGYLSMQPDEQEEEIKRLINLNKNLKFRCVQATPDGSLDVWAVVSTKWQKTTINEITPTLESVFPGKVEIVQAPTEFHGGIVKLNFGENDIMRFHGRIDAGVLDGMHAVKGTGGATILACLNQLSVEVSHKLSKSLVLPKADFELRSIHLTTGEDELKEKLRLVESTMTTFSDIKKTAETIQLTKDDAEKILYYYSDVTKAMSARTKEAVVGYLGTKHEQVPGTVWGLAMAVTYAGTHQDEMKDGVRNKLQKVGGELLIVTQKWNEYMELINSVQPPKKEGEVIVA